MPSSAGTVPAPRVDEHGGDQHARRHQQAQLDLDRGDRTERAARSGGAGRRWSSGFQRVADPVHGAHPLGPDLGAQRLHVAVDRARRAGAAVPAPDLGEQPLPGQDLARATPPASRAGRTRSGSGAPPRPRARYGARPGRGAPRPPRAEPGGSSPGPAARPARRDAAAPPPGPRARASGTAWSGSRRPPRRARRARQPRRRARSASGPGTGACAWIRRHTSSPSNPGSITSSTTRSGRCCS